MSYFVGYLEFLYSIFFSFTPDWVWQVYFDTRTNFRTAYGSGACLQSHLTQTGSFKLWRKICNPKEKRENQKIWLVRCGRRVIHPITLRVLNEPPSPSLLWRICEIKFRKYSVWPRRSTWSRIEHQSGTIQNIVSDLLECSMKKILRPWKMYACSLTNIQTHIKVPKREMKGKVHVKFSRKRPKTSCFFNVDPASLKMNLHVHYAKVSKQNRQQVSCDI